jgi:cyclase
MNWKRTFAAIGVAAAAAAGILAVHAAAQVNKNFGDTVISGDIEVLHIRDNVYALLGAGGNITASIGDEGILLVDTGLAQNADKVLAALRETSKTITRKPIQWILNTHFHPDHTGGNEKIRKAGVTFTGGNVAGNLSDAGEGASIIAHENVQIRMSGIKPALPFDSLPTDTYHIEKMNLSHFFNGEGVQLLFQPNAHTDGDSMVYFRRSDVLATGDVFIATTYPVIDLASGGNIQGILDALNHILDIAVPEFRLEAGTIIVPGHGRLCDSADVAYYRDAVTIIRDRIQDAMKRGQTLDQIKAAKLTMDQDGRYGATTGRWTTDMFVEAVYNSLQAQKK